MTNDERFKKAAQILNSNEQSKKRLEAIAEEIKSLLEAEKLPLLVKPISVSDLLEYKHSMAEFI